jgi:flagellar basal-body rod protein FlgF
MLRGIYTSASGMLVGQKRLDVVANNLANANTNGFKRDTTISQSFPELLLQRINDRSPDTGAAPQPVGPLGLGTFVSHTATRMVTGSMQRTDSPLDVAIAGDGFFAVNTAQGIRYTRQGHFMQNGNGTLVTPEGYEVLVDGRPVSATQGELAINSKGEVRAGDQVLGRLTIATSQGLGPLRKEGNGLWTTAGPTDSSTLIMPAEASGQYELQAGYLEASNVEAVSEMVDMMVIMRSFEANQRAIQVQDETLGKAVNEVGRIG